MSRLYQRTWGKGKSVVLVHGWAMHSAVWGDFAEQLAQHYCVTCIDLPGHGYSASCDEFTLAQISELLVKSVNAEKSYWLGWSLGATVVLDLAMRFPERVSGLIVLAGNPRFVQLDTQNSDDWPGVTLKAFDSVSKRLHINDNISISRFLSLQFYGLPEAHDQLQQLEIKLSKCAIPCLDILQSGLALLKHSDLRSVLSRLTMPVVFLLGEKDVLVPVSVGRYLLEYYPTVQVYWIANAGHALFQSHQHAVLTHIFPILENYE